MQDLILSIGAGPNQLPLIRAARAAGHSVWALDRDEAPAALPLLEGLLRHSSHDPEGAAAAVRRHPLGARTRLVLQRSSGPALATAAKVATALGCAGPAPAFCQAAVRKSALREACTALGIPAPPGRLVGADSGTALDGLSPLLLKPDMPLRGKAGITRLATNGHGREAKAAALARAVAASANGLAEAQSWLPGADVGLMLLFAEGRPCLSLAYDEINLWHPLEPGDAGGATGPAGLALSAPSIHAGPARLESLALPLAARLGLTHGFAFFSFRISADARAYLYEVNPGLCGDGIAERLLPAVFPGFDAFAAEVAAWTGRQPALPDRGPARPSTILDGRTLPGDARENEAAIAAAGKARAGIEVAA